MSKVNEMEEAVAVKYEIKEDGSFEYIDEGQGEIILLLHGLFGAISNWETVVGHFSKNYRVIIPMLPIYKMPKKEASVEGLTEYARNFVQHMGLKEFNLCGNSLGGHIALKYTLAYPEQVKSLILTGSSGLFESGMGGSFPKRGSYDYIKERVEYTFYDPKVATPEYIDEVFNTTNDISKCIRIVAMAKSAQRHNMAEDIVNIKNRTLLIWGLNDTITPPMVAHEFNRLIKNSELHFIDKCCHAAMMEKPLEFNTILEKFLNQA